MKVFEFVNDHGEGVISDWDIQKAQRIRLDLKLDLLVRAEFDQRTRKSTLPPQLVAGPIDGHQHIYKLKVKGNVQLRPMLCYGPFGDDEWTILFRATERGDRLIPSDAAAQADRCRLVLL